MLTSVKRKFLDGTVIGNIAFDMIGVSISVAPKALAVCTKLALGKPSFSIFGSLTCSET